MNKQHFSAKFDLRDSYEDLLQSRRKKSSPTVQSASGSDDRYLQNKPTAPVSSKNNFPEQSENWEKQFNQGSFTYNQAPAPSFSNEFQMASFDQYSNIYDDLDPQSGQVPPGPVGDIIPQAPQPPDIQWNQIQPAVQFPSRTSDLEEQLKKEAAIASEVRNQQATLLKQKEEYLRKVAVFKKELDTLKEQRTELKGSSKRSPSPDSRRFLKENGKLQLEIQTKLKTMHNVIDMLNGIIGDKKASSLSPPKVGKLKKSKKSKHSSGSSSPSPERDIKKSRSRSKSTTREKRFNYVYYDPEMHWCRLCNAFPPTAKDFLNHLHTAQHHRAAAAHMEAPWHSAPNLNEGLPNYPSAVTKRTPIRGLQFFVPSTAWYCKLCDHWIGDLHCASAHLKSIVHSKNYSNFVEQNPHWETDWMSDRQKSFEKVRGSSADGASKEKSAPYVAHTITFDKDGFSTKRKSEQSDPDSPPDKKKKEKKKSRKSKRRSSSSSSDSSRGSRRSRHNSKHKKIDKDKSKPSDKNTKQDDRMLAQWMTLEENQLSDQDKRILDNLKRRVKKRSSESSEKQQQEEQRRISREREARELIMLRARDSEKSVKKRESSKTSSHHNSNRNSTAKKEQAEPSRADKEKKTNADQKTTSTDQKKMPFIGKMPVFKSLTKPASKADSSQPSKSSESNDKKLDAEVNKRRAELDAEIQKKVAEFKEMMMRKKQETGMLHIGAPGLALPTTLGGNVGLEKAQPLGIPAYNFPQTIHRVQKDPVLVSSAPVTFMSHPTPPPRPNNINKNDPLHKDFQEALDIIFPSETKPKEDDMKIDPMNAGIAHLTQMPPPNLAPAYPVMPANYPPPNGPLPMPIPGNGPNVMMGGMFDYNQPQPFIPAFDMSQHPGNRMNQPLQMQHAKMDSNKKKNKMEMLSAAKIKKNEDLDDLAMLGIDVADVGASGF